VEEALEPLCRLLARGHADVLGGDGGDSVDLVSEPHVLPAEVLLVKGHLADHGGGRVATVGAGHVRQVFLVAHVLDAQLVVLHVKKLNSASAALSSSSCEAGTSSPILFEVQ
jgi:hypothetical protein